MDTQKSAPQLLSVVGQANINYDQTTSTLSKATAMHKMWPHGPRWQPEDRYNTMSEEEGSIGSAESSRKGLSPLVKRVLVVLVILLLIIITLAVLLPTVVFKNMASTPDEVGRMSPSGGRTSTMDPDPADVTSTPSPSVPQPTMLTYASSEQCGGELAAPAGRILAELDESGLLAEDQRCEWAVRVPAGRAVHLDFTALELETADMVGPFDCEFDYIQIEDMSGRNLKPYKICAHFQFEGDRTLTIPSDHVKVTFVTDGLFFTSAISGFELHYWSFEPTGTCELECGVGACVPSPAGGYRCQCQAETGYYGTNCQERCVYPSYEQTVVLEASAKEQFMSTPGYSSGMYPPSVRCAWDFVSRDGRPIMFEMVDVDLQPPSHTGLCRDALEFTAGTMRWSICGGDEPDVPDPAPSTSLTFTSNQRENMFRGARIKYYTV